MSRLAVLIAIALLVKVAPGELVRVKQIRTYAASVCAYECIEAPALEPDDNKPDVKPEPAPKPAPAPTPAPPKPEKKPVAKVQQNCQSGQCTYRYVVPQRVGPLRRLFGWW